MEVHHHSSQVKHKKWFHHFWEFFMMFLAITASFFVENQREHYIERKKEKQYMRSLLLDLRSDTLHLKDRISRNAAMVGQLDSLFLQCRNYRHDLPSLKLFYRRFDGGAGFVSRARLATRTITQLMNSGNMRLIHVQAISDSLLVYEERKNLMMSKGEGYKRENDIITDMSRRLLDYKYFFPFQEDSIQLGTAFNKELLFEFSNEVKVLKDQIESYVESLNELLGLATNIIKLIEKNYRVK